MTYLSTMMVVAVCLCLVGHVPLGAEQAATL